MTSKQPKHPVGVETHPNPDPDSRSGNQIAETPNLYNRLPNGPVNVLNTKNETNLFTVRCDIQIQFRATSREDPIFPLNISVLSADGSRPPDPNPDFGEQESNTHAALLSTLLFSGNQTKGVILGAARATTFQTQTQTQIQNQIQNQIQIQPITQIQTQLPTQSHNITSRKRLRPNNRHRRNQTVHNAQHNCDSNVVLSLPSQSCLDQQFLIIPPRANRHPRPISTAVKKRKLIHSFQLPPQLMSISNPGLHNLTDPEYRLCPVPRIITPLESLVLTLGPEFIPKPPNVSNADLRISIADYKHRVRTKFTDAVNDTHRASDALSRLCHGSSSGTQPQKKSTCNTRDEPCRLAVLERYLNNVEKAFQAQASNEPTCLEFYTNSALNQTDYQINYNNIQRYVNMCMQSSCPVRLINSHTAGDMTHNIPMESESSSSSRSSSRFRPGSESRSSHLNQLRMTNYNPEFSAVPSQRGVGCLNTISNVTSNLRNDPSIVINNTDKNLGLAIMPTNWYLDQAKLHLFNTDNYIRLTATSVPTSVVVYNLLIQDLQRIRCYDNFKSKLSRFIFELCPYFDRTISMDTVVPMSTFYMLPKVHKSIIATRPIVASIGSVTYNASKFVDFELQRVIRYFPSILLNSLELNRHVAITKFPPGIVLYSADVSALYPNIDITDGLKALRRAISVFNRDHPTDLVNIELIMVLSEWVLRHNYIAFGESMWRQKSGTAMGTPMAVVFANLYLLVLEWETIEILSAQDTFIRPLLFVRFIDDIFQIAVNKSQGDLFMDTFNTRRPRIKLESTSGSSVVFLDLELKVQAIPDGTIITVSIYQKPMNRYLYIPEFSYHQRSVFKSFIFSEIRRYRLSCSDDKCFFETCDQFRLRLLERGYNTSTYSDCMDRFEETRMNLLFTGNCKEHYCNVRSKFPDLEPDLDFNPYRKPAHNSAGQITPLIFKLPHTPRFTNATLKANISMEPYTMLFNNTSMKIKNALDQFKIPALLCKSRTKNIQDMLIRSKFQHQLPSNF